MSTPTTPTTYTAVTLAEAQPGDEILAGGTWQPVAAFHLWRDTVKLVFPSGGTQSMPVHHLGKIRRAVEQPTSSAAPIRTHDHSLGRTYNPRVAVCEQEARTGTGPRVCLTELDAHGQCPRAHTHTDTQARGW